MDDKSLTVLDDIIASACRAVFEGVGAPLSPGTAPETGSDDVGASIGFTGNALKGALVLISSKRFIKSVLPAEVRADGGPDQIADWMGELSNQLLGRIKNKLLAYGVTLEMSTPTVLFGLTLSRRDTRSGLRREFFFRHGDEILGLSLDALASPDFALTERAAETAPAIAEGEIALF